MADFYADSSALVKRHIYETGSIWLQGLLAPAAGNVILTARISMAEFYSALNRRIRDATLDTTEYTQVATDFDALCRTQYTLIELTPVIVERTRQLLERYTLRAYDAVQLASALIANNALFGNNPPSLTFLSADQRLLAAAQSEGLVTDDPNIHP